MLAFVIDDASFDQDGRFPIELLVWFTGFDKLCGVCPPGTVSMGGSTDQNCLGRSSQIESKKQSVSMIPESRNISKDTHTSAYRKMRFGPGFPDSALSFPSSFTLVTVTCNSFLASVSPLPIAGTPMT